MHFNRLKFKVNLEALKENVHNLQRLSNCQLIPMIKANAYGHGLIEIYHFLNQHCGLKQFGLASIEEALLIRKKTKNYNTELIVFSDLALFDSQNINNYVENKIIPVISSVEDFTLYLENFSKKSVPLFLKINTGMNRLGINPNEIENVVQLLKKNKIDKVDHLMTHFSSSGKEINPNSKSNLQYNLFKKIKNELIQSGINVIHSSVANSGAIEQGFGFDETHIRPGILLYGASVLAPEIKLKSKVRTNLISMMEATVINSFDVSAEMEIGYDDIKVKSDGKIVLIGIGYGDGLPTKMTGAKICAKNFQGQIVGKINMDMTAVLFPKEAVFEKGEVIYLWGEGHRDLSELTQEVGLIPYEVLCNIGQRVNKEYVLS